jgi:hypothetical protein
MTRMLRLLGYASICCLTTLDGHAALADGSALNQERVDAALDWATHRWADDGMNALPPSYNAGRLHDIHENGYHNLVEWIGALLMNANPGHEQDVVGFLNGDVLAFAVHEKSSFVCALAEVVYNNPQASLDDLKHYQPEMGEAYIGDLLYVLARIDAARQQRDLYLPDDPIYREVVTLRARLTANGGSLLAKGMSHLNCQNRPVS